MATLKGRNSTNSAWSTASVVWAWVTGSPSPVKTYAKKMEVRNSTNTGWVRAWTDCRLYDAGGRDWSAAVDVITYTGSCNNRTQTTTTTRTKDGCPNDVRAVTVASPNCDSACFTGSTSYYYTGTCQARTITTRTTYTANAGSGCTTYFTDGAPVASPTCGGNPPGPCWTEVTCNYAGQTNVTFAGEVFDYVYDFGGGGCWAARDSVPGYIVFFYLCGSTQGIYEAYIG